MIVRLHRMHEMQTIVTDVCGVCLSVCLSSGSAVCGAFMQTLPNYIALLFLSLSYCVLCNSLFFEFVCNFHAK